MFASFKLVIACTLAVSPMPAAASSALIVWAATCRREKSGGTKDTGKMQEDMKHFDTDNAIPCTFSTLLDLCNLSSTFTCSIATPYVFIILVVLLKLR
jgi:hypothetical protein